jgi:hypothetical protein
MIKPIKAGAAALAALILTGCVADAPDTVDGYDLKAAYQICIGFEEALIANRIACTQAVYGGQL